MQRKNEAEKVQKTDDVKEQRQLWEQTRSSVVFLCGIQGWLRGK